MRWHGYIVAGLLCAPCVAAEQAIQSKPLHIQTIAETKGELSEDLVQPLLELGRTQVARGELKEAEDNLRWAQHIIHRHEGVHALRQLEAIDLMTDVYLGRGEPYDADRQQQLALYLSERNFGKNSVENLPALYKLADWYADTGQFNNARQLVDRAAATIAAEGGKADLRLVEPLMKMAGIRRLQRLCCSYQLLEQALKIVDAQPEPSNDTRVEVLTALGDAYIAAGKDEEARRAWRQVWGLLGNDAALARFAEPEQIAMAKELADAERTRSNKKVYDFDQQNLGPSMPTSFGTVLRERTMQEQLRAKNEPPQQFLVPLDSSTRNFHIADDVLAHDISQQSRKVIGHPFQFILSQLYAIMPLAAQDEASLSMLSLELEFTVNEDGKVTDVEMLNEEAPLKLARLMREVLTKSKFRPRIVDGEPVKSEHVRLTQRFDK